MGIPWNPDNNGDANVSRMNSPLKSSADARPKTSSAESQPQNASSNSKKDGNRSEITFSARKPIYRLSDIVLANQVKQQIRILISRIRNHKLLYETWGLKRIDPQGTHIAVNFYGPPGTGKTMCAEGLASELQKDLIEVSYAEIESKYVGDTGKNIRNAFQRAKECDAVLFFDEADAILGSRMENVTQAADHAVDVARAVMLKELDSFDGIVVFATNKFEKFDRAFIRRILQHIEVPLPDEESRLKLWQTLFVTDVPGRDTLDWQQLAKESEGMSGGDIKNCVILACSEAAMDPQDRIAFAAEAGEQIEESQNPEKAVNQEICLRSLRKVQRDILASRGNKSTVVTQTLTREEYEQEVKKC